MCAKSLGKHWERQNASSTPVASALTNLLLFSICSYHNLPIFSMLGVSCTGGAYIHTTVCSGCLSGLLLLLLQGGYSWCLLFGLQLMLKTFCPNTRCCLPGMAFLNFTSDGEALPDVLLGEVPSHMFFPRAPRKAWDVIPSIGMMPSDEGGSETESLYEIEGMNKWILYL